MIICAHAQEIHCKAADTSVIITWLDWVFTTLEYDLPWPLDELKNILHAAHMCVGTMMRGGRQLSLDDWFVAASSGNHFTKYWFRLAGVGVEMGMPYLAKVRPKHHAFQHMIDFLEMSESRANPAYDACFMDEDCLACRVYTIQVSKLVKVCCLCLLYPAQDYVKKYLRTQRATHYGSSGLTVLQRSLITSKAALKKVL